MAKSYWLIKTEPIVETSEQAINCFLRTDMMRIKQPGKNSKFL